MKTLALLIALVSGSAENQNNISTSFKGLHFVICIDNIQLIENPEIKTKVCDTLSDNEYAVFKTKDYILACRNNNQYGEAGIKSEVRAYFNSTEISMDDAYTLMNNKNVQEAREYAEYSRKRIEEIKKETKDVKLFYSLTISMKNESTTLQKYTSEYVHTLKQSGTSEMIIIGKFLTFTDVKNIYDEIVANGISDISITASEFGKEIPVSSAVGKEQQYLEQLLAINE